MVFEGSLSAGVLIGVNMLIGKIFRPAQSLVEFPGEMKKLSQLLETFASATSLTTENRTAGNFHDIIGSVSFQDVSFVRDQTTSVMENVSFSIENQGDVICLLGPSGIGKTTILRTIAGLEKINKGSIKLNGKLISSKKLNIEPEKRVQAAHRYLRRPIHNLNKKEQNAIAADVMAVMEDPDFKTLFGQGTFSEVPISGTINGCIVTGRIDRIAINDRKITIIDYKTNRSPPKKTKDVSPVYIKQMATYRSLLRDIYPKREIVCVLAWTNSICLMTLPNELLDQYTS